MAGIWLLVSVLFGVLTTVMALATVKQWAWVQYAGDQLWHQRLVLGHLRPWAGSPPELFRVVIATPDADVYDEDYSGLTADIAAVRFSDARDPPPGIPRLFSYRFRRPPSAADLTALMDTGRDYASTVRRAEATAAGQPFAPHPQGWLIPLGADGLHGDGAPRGDGGVVRGGPVVPAALVLLQPWCRTCGSRSNRRPTRLAALR